MIERLKSTLEKIRQAREEEFQRLILPYMDNEECKKKQAELVLELPFPQT
jgi:hypothetical protein